jgi:hypothetical protein
LDMKQGIMQEGLPFCRGTFLHLFLRPSRFSIAELTLPGPLCTRLLFVNLVIAFIINLPSVS